MKYPVLLALAHAVAVLGAEAPFVEDFEKAEVGKLPAGFTAYAGGFKVAEEMGKKFLELPGAPLETFGVLFGPALQPSEAGGKPLTASGKFYGTSLKRKAPAFGISIGGVGGYRVQVSAAKGLLEIFKGDESRASAPFQWMSGSWTALRIQARQDGGKWIIEGKAWPADAAEPKAWTVTHEAAEAPPSGKAAVWGNPFSGTPIRYDDLTVGAADSAK